MPLSGGRYRVVTTKSGKKIRLHFKGGKVDEAKNLETGQMHTKEEFDKDMAKTHKKMARAPMVG